MARWPICPECEHPVDPAESSMVDHVTKKHGKKAGEAYSDALTAAAAKEEAAGRMVATPESNPMKTWVNDQIRDHVDQYHGGAHKEDPVQDSTPNPSAQIEEHVAGELAAKDAEKEAAKAEKK